MSRLLVKLGGAVAEAAARRARARATRHEVCVVHGAGPQITQEMARAGLPVEFVGGRRVTTPEAIAIVRASLAAVNAAVCAAIGARAVPLFGDEIGLPRRRCRSSALSATRSRAARPRSIAALEAGPIPVVAPIAVGPLNMNADEAAAALASASASSG